MRTTFAAWAAGDIEGRESYAAFETRVRDILSAAAAPGVRVLCVSSGGVIGMTLMLSLGLGPDRLSRLILPVGHTSITRFRVHSAGTDLFSYNAVPHLDTGERRVARTWV